MNVNKDVISKSISLLRFPLIFGVLLIHSVRLCSEGQYTIIAWNLLTLTICEISVPMFFIFSGYLFFSNIKKFNAAIYLAKLKSRVHTLLIPYMFWNLLLLIVIALGQLLMPVYFSGQFKPINEFTVVDFISIFWSTLGSGKPISFQLWFLRDLMVMVLLTPLFYFLSRYLKLIFIIILIALYIVNYSLHIKGVSTGAITMFGIGAAIAINDFTFYKIRKDNIVLLIVLYLAFVIFEQFFIGHDWLIIPHRINTLLGMLIIMLISFKLVDNGYKQNKLLEQSSFFIYCYHGIVMLVLYKVLKTSVPDCNDALSLFIYLFIPVLVSILGVYLYKLIKLFNPRIQRIVLGGR